MDETYLKSEGKRKNSLKGKELLAYFITIQQDIKKNITHDIRLILPIHLKVLTNNNYYCPNLLTCVVLKYQDLFHQNTYPVKPTPFPHHLEKFHKASHMLLF